ncbi:MAG: Regulatory protein AtoC [Phycisphaerae bacterium]|nr:Regulatory protein AtoC [Phycisphaerae bacterium]
MSDTAFILIVEPDQLLGQQVTDMLRRNGDACLLVNDGFEALQSIRKRPPDVVVTEYKLGGEISGFDVLRETRRLSPDTEVILMTAHGSEQLARDVLSRESAVQAYDYLIKPVAWDYLRDKIHRAAAVALTNKEHRRIRERSAEALEFEGLIGTSENMVQLLRKLKRIADSKITVLLLGETGSGKDLIAQAVHLNSGRRNKAYRAINCAGLNENLLESELFGHVKGAFTGAVSDRKGIFDAAHGGTLFLDEVGDMPLRMQAKLLRALENGEITPVGSTEVHYVDVRVVAATHRDLNEMIEEGSFRPDLFYRLNQVQLRIPPLRERRQDIPVLITRFLNDLNPERQNRGELPISVDPEALRKLTAYNWPGNVRQLKSLINGLAVQKETPVIGLEDLPEQIRGSTQIVPLGQAGFVGLSMADVERIHIANTLKLTSGNREKAAQMLGIGARTLYRKLKEYNLN